MKKIVLVSIVLLAGTAWAGTYSGGVGVGKAPYRISNITDWQELINTPADWGSSFTLTTDIDFGGQTITPVAADTSTSSGFQGTKFTGLFKGAGFVIENAVINQPTSDFVGLFGYLGTVAEISNLGVKNVIVTGQSSVGILAGENDGAITNCFTLGTANGNGDYAGGLVGYNSGTISLSYSQVLLNGAGWHNGGLAGYNTGSALNCYASGSVSGSGNVFGGLVGTNEMSTITDCYASCWIGSASYRGGLIGNSDAGTITSSYWDTTISTLSVSAGGTGKTTAQMKQQATFAGWDFSAAGWQITAGVSCPRLVSMPPAYSGGTGTSIAPYLISNKSDWLEIIYTASDYSNYFKLTADIDFGGQNITPIAPNTSSFDRVRFTGYLNGQSFAVRNIIINCHTENLVGLFGVVGSSGVIQNLDVNNISVSGRQYVGGLVAYNQGQISECTVTGTVAGTLFYVGGLAGWNENLVHQCTANVDASTDTGYYVGGLVGANSNGTITQCYATGDASSNSQYAGGLVGYNGGTTSNINNCFATGDVSASHISGGLAGANVCAISYCYSTGFVSSETVDDGGLVGLQNSPGTTIRSYWDTETSGKMTSAAGVGKTTEQMQLAGTFVMWDFANIWKLLGGNYPSLMWSVDGLTSDLDDSGVVDMIDFALFAEHWLDEGCQFSDWCSGCDLNASGMVNLVDFAIFADNFNPPTPITWVYISDPGVEGHEGFTGEMSKYETTNYQYCQFLNTALALGDIIVHTDNMVYAASDTSYSEPYLSTEAEHYFSQIAYSDGTFSVRTRDGLSMADHPVVMVSWYGATAFADYYGWRLPTEWQWQAVADYDGSYTYGCGTTIDQSKANYYETNPLGLTSMPYTSPVGHYPAYGYGLCDMAGNVWEWTSTVIGIYGSLCGGSWSFATSSYGDDNCAVSTREYWGLGGVCSFGGFRVCRGDLQPDITWVSIDDPGVTGHEGFTGEMSKYETTNAQYCQFLNSALATGDITVDENVVYGAAGSNSGEDFVEQLYYDLAGAGSSYNGATNGGAARINWTGSSFTVDAGFEDHPVTFVSWYGSTAFANYYGWRLPTEWEWQAVADYDGTYNYGCGTTIDNTIVNYWNSTHPDGTTAVGAFGTYGYEMADMAGNVWEWTNSIYSDSYRVLRGGGWHYGASGCTVSNGSSCIPGLVGYGMGFRVCRGESQPDITWYLSKTTVRG